MFLSENETITLRPVVSARAEADGSTRFVVCDGGKLYALRLDAQKRPKQTFLGYGCYGETAGEVFYRQMEEEIYNETFTF